MTDFYIRPGSSESAAAYSVGDSGYLKTWAIWMHGNGNTTTSDNRAGKFGVTKAGALYATDAHISGVVKVNTGYIGGENGWFISTNQISTGTLGNQNSFYLRSSGNSSSANIASSGAKTNWRLGIGSNFGVDASGNLYASGTGRLGGFFYTDDATNNKRLVWLEGAGKATTRYYANGFFSLFDPNESDVTYSSAPYFFVGANFTQDDVKNSTNR